MLFTFPSRYWFTIGCQVVFSLGRWSSQIQTGFLVSRPTQVPSVSHLISPTRLSLSLAELSSSFEYQIMNHLLTVLQPHSLGSKWFGLVPVRSPLLRKSFLLSFPAGTKMFQFPTFASIHYLFMYGCHSINHDGFPHSEISGSILV